MEAKDMDRKNMDRKVVGQKEKEVKDISQVHLAPLSAVVDEVWGEKGTPRPDFVIASPKNPHQRV